jgi:uncharacterized delta-60 repeat protein
MKHFVYSLITLLQVGFLCNAAQVGFNKVGYVTNVPNNSSIYRSVAVQPADGKIVVVGQTDDDNGLIARFNADGALDSTFNNGTGFINTEGGTISFAYHSVAVQPDGKIVAVGLTDNSGRLIARFTSLGALDATFNAPHGFINIEGDTNSFAYYSVAVQPDGKIVAVGQTDWDNDDNANGLIARFTSLGALDTTFNNGAGFITNVPNTSQQYNSVALQPDGKIVAVGITDGNDPNGLIARFNTDGNLDNTFGTNGVVTNIPNNSFGYYSVAVQADGKIVVVGTTDEDAGDRNGLIARFTSLGGLDTTFNGTGFINADLPTNSNSYYSVAIQADGKIVAVGRTNNGNGLIARFTSLGELDATFNAPHGFINIIEGDTNAFAYYSVALQPDGKIVAVGEGDQNDDVYGLIARFLPNGVLDAESKSNLKSFREYAKNNNISIALLG